MKLLILDFIQRNCFIKPIILYIKNFIKKHCFIKPAILYINELFETLFERLIRIGVITIFFNKLKKIKNSFISIKKEITLILYKDEKDFNFTDLKGLFIIIMIISINIIKYYAYSNELTIVSLLILFVIPTILFTFALISKTLNYEDVGLSLYLFLFIFGIYIFSIKLHIMFFPTFYPKPLFWTFTDGYYINNISLLIYKTSRDFILNF